MKVAKIFFTAILFTTVSCAYFENNNQKPVEITSQNNVAEKQYVVGVDDIPLFLGLELDEEDSSVFDTMLGKIVISKYLGDVQLKSVISFYLEVLPQLGWRLIDNKDDRISFKRENDKLEIRFNYAKTGLYVRFFISSAIQ